MLDRGKIDALIEQIQALESEAHKLGMTLTGHALNKAKNQAGWELASKIERSRP